MDFANSFRFSLCLPFSRSPSVGWKNKDSMPLVSYASAPCKLQTLLTDSVSLTFHFFSFEGAIGKLPAASPNLIPLLSDLVNPSDPFLLYL